MIECVSCGQTFEPMRTRWLCPTCGWKESCCEGEPLGCAGPEGSADGVAEGAPRTMISRAPSAS